MLSMGKEQIKVRIRCTLAKVEIFTDVVNAYVHVLVYVV